MLKIRFLYHSAFLLETDSSLLLFDAYRTDFMIPEGKKLFVFSSHFHQDHFSPDLLFTICQARKLPTFKAAEELRFNNV